MKLSADDQQSLFDLSVATDRANKRYLPLVRHGLAEQGAGRFGTFARITKKGLELVRSWPWEKRNAHDHAWNEAIVSEAFTNLDRTSSSGSRAAATRSPARNPGVSTSVGSDAHSGESPILLGARAAPSRRVGASKRAGGSTPDGQPSPPAVPLKVEAPNTPGGARPPARGDATKAAPTPTKRTSAAAGTSIQPNAVRVQIGNKVTYYPVTSFASIKDASKQLVRTLNKCFKQYPLTGAGADVVC